MDEWMGRWVDGWMDEWMNGWVDEWMDEWMGRWVDRWSLMKLRLTLKKLGPWVVLTLFSNFSSFELFSYKEIILF